MNIRKAIYLILTVFIFHITRGAEVTFPEITNVTKIVVRTDNEDWFAVKWITETQQVQKITSFINQQRRDWDQPMLTVAGMGSTILDLYDEKGHQTSFGIGENFFGTERSGETWWKIATEDQKKELLLLIGDLPTTFKDVILPDVLQVTTILVLTNGAVASDKTIINLEQIQKVTKFINQEHKGWQKPESWVGKRTPLIVLELKHNEEFLREFGIGENYFETVNYDMDNSIPRYKKTTKAQSEDILKLIDFSN